MKTDPIDVMLGALYSVYGRVFLTGAVVLISGTIGIILQAEAPCPITEALCAFVPTMIFSTIGGIGLFTIPAMFGFTLLFARYEWRLFLLIIPAALSYMSVISVLN